LRGGRSRLAVAVAALLLACGATARADEKTMCSDKYQSAQRSRAAGKLTLARADLLRCAEQACPPFVSNDCKTWLAEVEADLPTLVFAVLDPDGRDVPSAAVRVDGVGIANATDGLGHAVDPGGHLVEALAKGQLLRQQIVVRVGEKSRRIELHIAPVASAASPPQASIAPAALAPAPGVGSSGPPVGAFVLGGLGLAAIGVGSVLWVTGSNAAQTYNDACETGACTASQRDNAHTQLVAGDIAWGVGLAAGIAAVTVLLLHHGDGGGVAVSFGANGMRVGGRF
jgi:hypothetical protein